MLKPMQKAIPTADPSTLSTMASQASPAGGKSSGATTEQLLGQLAGEVGSAGQQSSSTFKAAPDNENEWRSDRPPAAWPVFPPDHPLSKPVKKRTTAQAIALAAEVEERWAQFKAGNPNERPSPDDIREALGALLAIDPKDAGFPRAWAAFVRLRKIQRDAGAYVIARPMTSSHRGGPSSAFVFGFDQGQEERVRVNYDPIRHATKARS